MVNGVVGGVLSVVDRGFAYGDGLFETMRFVNGQIPLLDFHFQRLHSSCGRLGIPYDNVRLAAELQRFTALCPAQDGLVKLIYTRGEAGHGYYPPLPDMTIPTTIFIYTRCAQLPSEPATMVLLSHRLTQNRLLAGMKHQNRLEYVLAAREISPKSSGADQHGLLLDSDGWVIETLHHNIFLCQFGRLVTPKLGNAGVKGVMRRLIIEELAKLVNLPVIESNIRLEDVANADEVFVCNSVRGLQPIADFAERSWQQWPVTTQLQRVLANYWGIDAAN